MPVPIVSFVGRSNSGKTTLIEDIIQILKRYGFKVGVIKHDAHRFDIDHPGKDSWRFTKAGADTMVITSAGQLAMVKVVERQKSVPEIADELFGDVDIVIVEGYKGSTLPKIEVVRFDAPVMPADQLLAWVDNRAAGPIEPLTTGQEQTGQTVEIPEEYSQVACFSFNDKERIAEMIIADFIGA